MCKGIGTCKDAFFLAPSLLCDICPMNNALFCGIQSTPFFSFSSSCLPTHYLVLLLAHCIKMIESKQGSRDLRCNLHVKNEWNFLLIQERTRALEPDLVRIRARALPGISLVTYNLGPNNFPRNQCDICRYQSSYCIDFKTIFKF